MCIPWPKPSRLGVECLCDCIPDNKRDDWTRIKHNGVQRTATRRDSSTVVLLLAVFICRLITGRLGLFVSLGRAGDAFVGYIGIVAALGLDQLRSSLALPRLGRSLGSCAGIAEAQLKLLLQDAPGIAGGFRCNANSRRQPIIVNLYSRKFSPVSSYFPNTVTEYHTYPLLPSAETL